ncbi:MAG TPA: hydrogenase/urease maturation nickel metallochaperone HypA, partial [Acidimicrobiales bacterium]|nr:hydrogenase/urease maturation nickel metallochaperone HypA [Acidimicrobiales bacterium]
VLDALRVERDVVVVDVAGHRVGVATCYDIRFPALFVELARRGAELVVEDVPAVVRCRACGARTTLEWPVLVCATCDGRDVELVSGEELLVVAIDVRAVA